jgi:gp16 family phage-associated protein
MRIYKLTKNEIESRLKLKGQSVRSFARDHGYKDTTVYRVIIRFVGTGRKTRGKTALAILEDLSAAIE